MTIQTKTPDQLLKRPDKEALLQEFAGKPLDALRTPAMVIDRTIFAENCAKMISRCNTWGVTFRAHLKTHKTVEGTRLQLQSADGRTQAIVVSTIMEAREVVNAGLVSDSTVKDILYGLPVAANKIADLSELWDTISEHGGIVRVLIDHPEQVKFLENYESTREKPRKWSVLVKVDSGLRRAGVTTNSPLLQELLTTLFSSSAVSVYGFYGHAGHSYASKSPSDASSFLASEVEAVNAVAQAGITAFSDSLYKEYHQQPFVLSVGSTPTAHAVSPEAKALLSSSLCGILELHAGNYPMLDLQQQYTGMIDSDSISQRVIATVVSYYPGRGEQGKDEALIDAGALAFSKDTGRSRGYGDVIGKGWQLDRMAQEHGILTRHPDDKTNEVLQLGSRIEIIGQHACLIAAGYPWFYIVDKNIDQGRKVVDIWVPWKGW